MAAYLGVDISTVSRLESREQGDEPSAISRLLDLLEANPLLMPADETSQAIASAGAVEPAATKKAVEARS